MSGVAIREDTKKLVVFVPEELAEALERFRYERRLRSISAAVRTILEEALDVPARPRERAPKPKGKGE